VPLSVDDGAIEAARSGGAGVDRLIAAVWPEAYRIAFGVLRDRGLAEDAAQEACASIARGLPSLKNTAAFSTWSYKIIVNRAISAARARPRTLTLDSSIESGVHVDRTVAVDLSNALSRLSVVQRAAVILHYYAGLNSREIAAATGVTSATVRFHLMLARRALRKALSSDDACGNQSVEEAATDAR
jgi:RNA polymerase sigma-70 factor (ECF subfamily)